MPVIYMTHEVHGAKVANIEAEAVADEKNGWVRYNPDTPSAPEEAANTLAVKRKYTRKAEAETEGV